MKIKILLLSIIVSVNCVFAQTTMTLEDCVKYGVENNVKSKNAQIDQQIAKEKVKETTGIGLPNLSGSANYTDMLVKPTSVFPASFGGGTGQFGTKHNADIGVTVSQLIFDGSYLIGLQAAKTYRLLAEKQQGLSKVEIAANIHKAYFGVLINKERAILLSSSVAQLDSTLSEMKALYRAGFIEKIDVDRTQVSLNNLKLNYSKTVRYRDFSYKALKLQMGMPLEEVIVLASNLSDFSANLPLDDSFTVTDRPEYHLMEVQYDLNKLDLKNEKIKYLPSLAGFYNFKRDAQREKFNFFHSDSDTKEYPWFNTEIVGLKMTIPIFDGGQTHHKIQQKKMEMQKTENNLLDLKNGLTLELESTKMLLKNSIDELKVQQENQALASEVYRVSKEKYTKGVGSNLELITAETSKIEADNNYYNALYNALINKTDLQKATGKLQY